VVLRIHIGEAAVTITTGGLAVSAGAATLAWRSRVVDCGLAGGATITDIGLVHHCWDVTLSDDDLDVSGTGTFGEAVTTTTEVLLLGRCSHDWVGDQDWWTVGSAGVCYHYDTGLMVTAGDVTLSDGNLDVSGAWNIR
jgi:hypothetical protein